MFHPIFIKVNEFFLSNGTCEFSFDLGVRTIDWSDALTQQKKTTGMLGVYAPSKLFQILSSYKLKKDLFGTNSSCLWQ